MSMAEALRAILVFALLWCASCATDPAPFAPDGASASDGFSARDGDAANGVDPWQGRQCLFKISGAFATSLNCVVELQPGRPGFEPEYLTIVTGCNHCGYAGIGGFAAAGTGDLTPGTYRPGDLPTIGISATKENETPNSAFVSGSDLTLVLYELDNPVPPTGLLLKTHGTVDATLTPMSPSQPTQGTVTLHVDF